MQVLNIDTGTAEPIKHLSALVASIDEESKMSDRELIGLILTIKGCRDCLRINRQLDYRSARVVRSIIVDKFESCALLSGKYFYSVDFKHGIEGFFKDLRISAEGFNLIMKDMEVKHSFMPEDVKLAVEGGELVIKSKYWIGQIKTKYMYFKVESDKPIKPPFSFTISYLSASLPIPMPEKYMVNKEDGFWNFTKLHDTQRWRGEIVEF